MTAKVLVIVKDGQIVVRHTTGVETAVIVDGENVNLPDDWQKLPWRPHQAKYSKIRRKSGHQSVLKHNSPGPRPKYITRTARPGTTIC
jgi:hypothetical protein